MRSRRLGALLAISHILHLSVAPASADEGVVFFESEILPLLEEHCYDCHSLEAGKSKGGLVLDSRVGWEKGGGSGPAVVPGKPDESLLIEAIRHEIEDMEMPPKETLPGEAIALFEEWVAMGAPDPRESQAPEIDPEKLWALDPIQLTDTPAIKNTSWPRDVADHFLLARLEAEGLSPQADADRYTLLRRITFDLTGLPPTPEEIEAFVADTSGNAYEKVVDRLLASSAFGDHWGRHWFDLSCYADLADVQGNVLIRDAWRYRDYVIASLNEDKPFDQFIQEQIAGDLLPYQNVEQRREQIVATGYLAIGPWVLQNYIKGQLDADVVDHQIDRIGRTFLGQTISCARCHDHKFDPVPTADYYALAGIFHSTLTTSYDGPGVWSAINEVALPKPDVTAEEKQRRARELSELQSRRRQLQGELTSLVHEIPGGTEANALTLVNPIAANQEGAEYELSFLSGPSVWASAPQRTTAADGIQIDLLRNDGSVLAGFLHCPGPWSGTKSAQRLKKTRYSYTGDGSGGLRLRITSSTPGSGRFGGAIDNIAISSAQGTVYEENFNQINPSKTQGSQINTKLRVHARASVPGWRGSGLNHSHAVELVEGNYAIQFFGGREGILAKAQPETREQKKAHADAMGIEKELTKLSKKLEAGQDAAAPDHALAVMDVEEPADSPIYRRGDFQNLGEIVPRGFLSAVSMEATHAIPEGTSGRLQLAQWLTDSHNPLPPRVLVNRVWHHLFGQGLVRSVDYFGVHGEMPSHPELLDYLALRFIGENEWSLKKTIRQMVLTRTYQMASTHNAAAAAIDPDNRLLWQMPRRRLTAESIRDAMLAISGELDPKRGGPSLGLEMKGNIKGAGGNVNPPTWGNKTPDYVANRRTVYLPLKRERPVGELEILSTFDFPHPSEITGARPNTTVATQALFLTNAPFVKKQAAKLSERLVEEEASNERARINRLYLLTAGRPAAKDEIEIAMSFLGQTENELKTENARREAWTQLCHALLGSNQFLFRE